MSTPQPSDISSSPHAARNAYRGACAVALAAAFLLIWINGAVGILGSENNPLNLVYAGVLAVAAVGALVVGFEARAMARVMQLTAATQVLVGALVLALGYFTPVVTAVFVGLWLLSAWLYAKAGVDAPAAPMPVPMRTHPFWRRMRWLVWTGAAGLLLLPAVAMQFTDEVDWSPFDFVVMGLLLGSVGAVFELALRMARSHAYMIGSGVAAGTGFLAVWVNLAVGIIGSEQNPANAMFFAVLVIAFFGAVLAQLQPRGLVRAMQVTAAA
ncbi:MAG TPA: hypothetical protein VFY12_07480, partial [Arenimonas sp.]|nr:hypothetical protein [Arenimonas sp.]